VDLGPSPDSFRGFRRSREEAGGENSGGELRLLPFRQLPDRGERDLVEAFTLMMLEMLLDLAAHARLPEFLHMVQRRGDRFVMGRCGNQSRSGSPYRPGGIRSWARTRPQSWLFQANFSTIDLSGAAHAARNDNPLR